MVVNRPVVEVVAAVITQPDGSYLLAERPAGKVYAGYWEFPGGKIEPGETPLEAIRREILEELGLEITAASQWLMRRHVYEHASVRLRFFRVTRWRGEPIGLEGQRFAFQMPGIETVGPMLPANGPVLKALSLPSVYGISQAGEMGSETFLSRLDTALAHGLRLVQLREKSMAADRLAEFAAAVARRCRAHSARLVVNSDFELARQVRADGVHLTALQLREMSARPDFGLVGASAHDAAEIAKAAALGCDFAVLGPVLPTPSHTGEPSLGWNHFATLARDAELPVYALGGLMPSDANQAAAHGAHGIAMMRGAWPE
jgi:8-oxo-dGTP diphosphatase